MSVYNKTAVICYRLIGSTAGLKHFITVPNDFMVKKLWAVTFVAGAQATHKVQLTNVANDVTYAEVTTGTTAAGTLVSASVAEASRNFPGGTVVALRDVVNDASAVHDVYVLIAHAE